MTLFWACGGPFLIGAVGPLLCSSPCTSDMHYAIRFVQYRTLSSPFVWGSAVSFFLRFLVPHLAQLGLHMVIQTYPRWVHCPGFILWAPQRNQAFPWPFHASQRSQPTMACAQYLRVLSQTDSACHHPIPCVVPRWSGLRAAMPLSRSGAGHGPICGLEALIALALREICTSAPKDSALAGRSPSELASDGLLVLCPGHISQPRPGSGFQRLGQVWLVID
jgi:hypothetical protein